MLKKPSDYVKVFPTSVNRDLSQVVARVMDVLAGTEDKFRTLSLNEFLEYNKTHSIAPFRRDTENFNEAARICSCVSNMRAFSSAWLVV